MKSSIKTILLLILFLFIFTVIILKVEKKGKKEATLTIDYTEDIKGLGYSGQRKIAQDSLGNYFVTYRKKYQGKYQIFVAKVYYQKSNWKINGTDKPAVVVDSIADQRVPSISIDKDNVIYVSWYGSDSKEDDRKNDRQIKFIKSSDSGASWSQAKNISIVEGFDNSEDYWQEHPYLLVGDGNILYVIWEGKDVDNKNQQIKFSKSLDNGNTWSQWKNILVTPDNTQSRPTMVQTTDGRLHLFSYSSSENPSKNQQIKYSWSDDKGDSWSKWSAVTDAALDSRHVSAADNGKDVHIAWRQINSDGKSQIMYKVLNGENWGQSIVVAESSDNQFFPSITVSNEKRISVAWMEDSNTSALPREDPKEGKIYLTELKGDKFSSPLEISSGERNLYPNVPAYASNLNSLVYEKFQSDNKYDVILKIFK